MPDPSLNYLFFFLPVNIFFNSQKYGGVSIAVKERDFLAPGLFLGEICSKCDFPRQQKILEPHILKILIVQPKSTG